MNKAASKTFSAAKRVLVCLLVLLVAIVVAVNVYRYKPLLPPLPSTMSKEPAAPTGTVALPAGTTRTDSRGVEQVWVPPGCFRMGADPTRDSDANWFETPEHDVYLSQSFWLDKYEVTNASFEEFVGDGG